MPIRTFAACLLITTSIGGSSSNASDKPQPAQPAGASPAGMPHSNKTAEPKAGHSMHGEAFNEGPRQAAYLMEGTGPVRFPVTTKSEEAQKFVTQGVGQLHGFWYFEAERSFRQAAKLDPECATCYWGMAQANIENENRAKGFIEKAVQKKANVSRREQRYIESWHKFLTSKKDDKERRKDYIQDLEDIIHEFPDDIEAKAFLATTLWRFHDKVPMNSHEPIDAMIKQILAVEPMHPAHHFMIHLWDVRKPERALHSAAHCGQGSPAIAHMWHMPGHTFSKLKRYEEGAWQQEASARVDHAYMARDRVMPYQIHNYAHNNEWLVRNLIYLGRVRDAMAVSKSLIEVPFHPKRNQIEDENSCAGFGRRRLLDVLTDYELWDELIALSETVYLEPTDIPREQARRLLALGRAYFTKGDISKGKETIADLVELMERQREEQFKAIADAEKKARDAKEPEDKIKKAKENAGNPFADRLKECEASLAELAGHRALAEGRYDVALDRLAKAKDFPKVWLARAYLKAGRLDKAEETARKAVEDQKNEVLPLAQWIEILHRSGKKEETRTAFEKLRPLAGRADLDAPIFERLGSIAKGLGLPTDWRLPQSVPKDAGIRPDLDKLGPLRWRPSSAPDWKLTSADDKPIALADYRGRPVVVIFYLGAGCLHCIEQLGRFGPLTKDFEKAGISLIAISTDSLPVLKQSAIDFSKKGNIAFPLASDSGLSVFKKYRAFDDFESKPLHATVLIDGNGLIRWQDISFEPFANAGFLLKESQRLLKLPSESTNVAARAPLTRVAN